jgi:hypothetical protein
MVEQAPFAVMWILHNTGHYLSCCYWTSIYSILLHQKVVVHTGLVGLTQSASTDHSKHFMSVNKLIV